MIVPFRGGLGAARRALAALGRLELAAGDELRIADNSNRGVLAGLDPRGATVVRADRERSSYHARNAAAREADGEWLLFVDADCAPRADLLDAYFSRAPGAAVAILAGAIHGDEAQTGLAPRYARDRNFLSQSGGLHACGGTAAATGNLLVRRAAFEAIGGFAEGIRSGGDVDLCWRLGAEGWLLEHRPDAVAVHSHRETLVGLICQVARYGAGARWLDRRHPGAAPRWPLLEGLAGSGRDIAAHLTRGRLEQAVFRGVDALGLVAHNIGYASSNRARPGRLRRARNC